MVEFVEDVRQEKAATVLKEDDIFMMLILTLSLLGTIVIYAIFYVCKKKPVARSLFSRT